ncbi:2,3-diaminopropionate biosynthesis protein SbnB [Micromonospora sp. NPDC023633]|uniref:2,3-diaminopropionate biosynthesis protein SbnB n=1 Tax=Micromonospora sp. NPDC023633 TaxID=3154320 RepID=UPI0033FE0B32
MSSISVPEFRVYSGEQVRDVLDKDHQAVVAAVEAAYRAHHVGRTVNPDSYFLRFPGRDADRIIALPARYVSDGGAAATGIKWISSFPQNIERGIARASAVLILNDESTGYPIACMEAGSISATRTAASAVSGLRLLSGDDRAPKSIAVIGTGVISNQVLTFLDRSDVPIERIALFDANRDYAARFAARLRERSDVAVDIAPDIGTAIRSGEVVLFATTAGTPHVHDPALFEHCPIVLHLSLRDLSPEIILSAHNVVDDVDHCMKARTSLHLAEMQTGSRDFVAHTLPGILCGAPIPERDRPVIFSPFGMGILDIALGDLVHSLIAGATAPVKNFYLGAERF